MDIIKKIAEELQIRPDQVQAVVNLIDEGNTIPFIARYRKEAHGALNDEILRNLDERLTYLRNLEEKKSSVLASMEELGVLTDDLKKKMEQAQTLAAGKSFCITGKRCGKHRRCTFRCHGYFS